MECGFRVIPMKPLYCILNNETWEADISSPGDSSPDISSPILFAVFKNCMTDISSPEFKKLYDGHFVPRICIIELIASNKTKKYYLYLTQANVLPN